MIRERCTAASPSLLSFCPSRVASVPDRARIFNYKNGPRFDSTPFVPFHSTEEKIETRRERERSTRRARQPTKKVCRFSRGTPSGVSMRYFSPGKKAPICKTRSPSEPLLRRLSLSTSHPFLTPPSRSRVVVASAVPRTTRKRSGPITGPRFGVDNVPISRANANTSIPTVSSPCIGRAQ